MIRGERIRERMTLLGLSQAELARRVGVAQPTIFQLINRSKKGSTKLHVIARELETSPAYLSGETDDPDPGVTDGQPLDSQERQLLGYFARLKAADRKALVQMAKSLSSSAATASVHAPGQSYRVEAVPALPSEAVLRAILEAHLEVFGDLSPPELAAELAKRLPDGIARLEGVEVFEAKGGRDGANGGAEARPEGKPAKQRAPST